MQGDFLVTYLYTRLVIIKSGCQVGGHLEKEGKRGHFPGKGGQKRGHFPGKGGQKEDFFH